ncbi:hypothetical protein R3P38DRAFT_3454165 [Favolaschia claudopus]|uniref:Chromo domain-containing protein n=1 Tax=Favolaschia claudopus TaxID=2862362 RepID=A0AAV9ZIH5_9AGAR
MPILIKTVNSEASSHPLTRLRGLYAWHRQLSRKFLVPITKDMYRTVQACIRFDRELKEEMFASAERHSIQRNLRPSCGTPQHLIAKIISRELVNDEIWWKVEVQGLDCPLVVPEGNTEWLFQSPNCDKLRGFIQRHIPLTSPALRKMYATMLKGDKPLLVPEPLSATPDMAPTNDKPYAGSVLTPLFLPASDDEDEDALSQLSWLDNEDAVALGQQPNSDGGETPNDDGGRAALSQGGADAVGGASVEQALAGPEERGIEKMNVDEESARSVEGKEKESQVVDDVAVGNPAAGEADRSYEIQGILEYDEERGVQRWKVRWKGYDATQDSYLQAQDFEYAYNKRNGIKVVEQTEKRPTKRKRSPDPGASEKETGEKDSAPPADVMVVTSQFTHLLSSTVLEQEIRTLNAPSHSSSSIRLINPATLLTNLTDLNITNTWIASYLQYDSLSNQSSIIRLARIQEGVQATASLLAAWDQVVVLQHAIQWELGRILLIVYEWLMDTGPALVKDLLLSHKRGVATLNERFPSFARLTDHVMRHVQALQKINSSPPQKKRKISATQTAPSDPSPSTVQPQISKAVETFPPVNLNLVPADLYGLREGDFGGKQVNMPKLGKIHKTALSLDQAAYNCLYTLLCRELVWIPMTEVDNWLNSEKRTKKTSEGIHARLVARGAVLQCIVNACGEGILASDALRPVLMTPTALFSKKFAKDERLMKAIETRAEATLKPLCDKLADIVEDDPDILFYAEEVSRITHHRTLELQLRRSLTTAQIVSPHALPPSRAPQKSNGSRKINRIPAVKLSVAELIRAEDLATVLALPALILREARNKMVGGPAVNVSLRRILEGKNPSTGTEPASANLDHVNPARAASVNLQLLRTHIPGSKATSRLGLSNLLAWMITGQGYSTRHFLSQDSGKLFFFGNVEDCVSHFREAQAANESVVSEYLKLHPKASLAQMKGLAEYVVLDDPNVWGQASNELGLNPTIRGSGGKTLSLDEKFGDPFSVEKVQLPWKKWLGSLFEQDPNTYTGQRHTWEEAITMIRSLGINGVKGDGLTTLQLANNLVFLGICSEPSSLEMGAWISQNTKLGAYRGLCLLGFKLHELDPIAIRVALSSSKNVWR